jgi:hypothetical protein
VSECPSGRNPGESRNGVRGSGDLEQEGYRRSEGLPLDDEPGGGHPVHGPMPQEIQAILELFAE